MANRIEYNVVGRYINEDDARDVVGYHLTSLDGIKTGRYGIDQLAFLIGRGQIKNCSAQIYQDKILFRGEGISLDQLPVQKVHVDKSKRKKTDGTTSVVHEAKPVAKQPVESKPVQDATPKQIVAKPEPQKKMTSGEKLVRMVSQAFIKKYNATMEKEFYEKKRIEGGEERGDHWSSATVKFTVNNAEINITTWIAQHWSGAWTFAINSKGSNDTDSCELGFGKYIKIVEGLKDKEITVENVKKITKKAMALIDKAAKEVKSEESALINTKANTLVSNFVKILTEKYNCQLTGGKYEDVAPENQYMDYEIFDKRENIRIDVENNGHTIEVRISANHKDGVYSTFSISAISKNDIEHGMCKRYSHSSNGSNKGNSENEKAKEIMSIILDEIENVGNIQHDIVNIVEYFRVNLGKKLGTNLEAVSGDTDYYSRGLTCFGELHRQFEFVGPGYSAEVTVDIKEESEGKGYPVDSMHISLRSDDCSLYSEHVGNDSNNYKVNKKTLADTMGQIVTILKKHEARKSSKDRKFFNYIQEFLEKKIKDNVGDTKIISKEALVNDAKQMVIEFEHTKNKNIEFKAELNESLNFGVKDVHINVTDYNGNGNPVLYDRVINVENISFDTSEKRYLNVDRLKGSELDIAVDEAFSKFPKEWEMELIKAAIEKFRAKYENKILRFNVGTISAHNGKGVSLTLNDAGDEFEVTMHAEETQVDAKVFWISVNKGYNNIVIEKVRSEEGKDKKLDKKLVVSAINKAIDELDKTINKEHEAVKYADYMANKITKTISGVTVNKPRYIIDSNAEARRVLGYNGKSIAEISIYEDTDRKASSVHVYSRIFDSNINHDREGNGEITKQVVDNIVNQAIGKIKAGLINKVAV